MPDTAPHKQRPAPEHLRSPEAVTQAIAGLKAQAKAGQLLPIHATYAAMVGEAVRAVLSPSLGESDRSAELIFIFGCFVSDPKMPQGIKPVLHNIIDAVSSRVFSTDNNFIAESIQNLYQQGRNHGYGEIEITRRFSEIREVMATLRKGHTHIGWLNGAILAAINNALVSPMGSLDLMLLEGP